MSALQRVRRYKAREAATVTKDAYINKLAEDDIKRIEWATHSTTIDPLELLDMLAERLLILKQIKEQE